MDKGNGTILVLFELVLGSRGMFVPWHSRPRLIPFLKIIVLLKDERRRRGDERRAGDLKIGWLQRHGHIDKIEMERTFNCGIGMVLIVGKRDAQATLELLKENGVEAYEIGAITERKEGEPQTVVV